MIEPRVDAERCPVCETSLQWRSGDRLVVFTAHDEAFCRDACRQLINDLRVALQGQQEAFARSLESARRAADQVLADAGLPTLSERAWRLRTQIASLDKVWPQ